jgi:hypothetical protein
VISWAPLGSWFLENWSSSSFLICVSLHLPPFSGKGATYLARLINQLLFFLEPFGHSKLAIFHETYCYLAENKYPIKNVLQHWLKYEGSKHFTLSLYKLYWFMKEKVPGESL